MVEAFPIEARYSAVAIGYNGAHAVLGGTILLIATVLVKEEGYGVVACLVESGLAPECNARLTLSGW